MLLSKKMKKNIIKKIFIKISKLLGFELIDQNEFKSPTLNKEINQSLSSLNKSIVLPLGEVKLTRKINSLLVIFRTNTNINIWDQNKKRIFEKPKIEYTLKSLNSLIKSIKFLNSYNKDLYVNLKIVDNGSKDENLKIIKDYVSKLKIDAEIILHDNDEYKQLI